MTKPKGNTTLHYISFAELRQAIEERMNILLREESGWHEEYNFGYKQAVDDVCKVLDEVLGKGER